MESQTDWRAVMKRNMSVKARLSFCSQPDLHPRLLLWLPTVLGDQIRMRSWIHEFRTSACHWQQMFTSIRKVLCDFFSADFCAPASFLLSVSAEFNSHCPWSDVHHVCLALFSPLQANLLYASAKSARTTSEHHPGEVFCKEFPDNTV